MNTNIKCNGCPDLKILKRKIMDHKRTDRNTWILECKKISYHIGVFDVRNNDLKNKQMPEVKAPFHCPLRQELGKQNKESKFILQIT